MAEAATLARPYALAAFDIARERERFDHWSHVLEQLAQVTSTPKLSEYLSSPVHTTAAKAITVIDLLEDDLTESTKRFVRVLAENHRLDLIPEIRATFEELLAEERKTLAVEVTTAVELTPEEIKAFDDALTRKYQREINLTIKIDPEIVGGALIRAGDTVLDGTVRGKLEKLQTSLMRT
ncbi:MAG: F0F1 ATP synthase subunit delta [Gammaproteobacteria bacterium]|nr:F0F1 ATP synthase subunit delta [Gammaproteobacteria bacterium]MYF01756.1 F0F1 ATP synthase subunit delta [Gammaproteobacteria bacterium]MYI77340.1 F0F1 ATP synthase subunit delta [Gammaproteobacteria bacterium]